MIDLPPAYLIDRVLDRANLPHIRQLDCRHNICKGTVRGHRTTWYLTPTVRLVCVCYLPNNVPTPIERP